MLQIQDSEISQLENDPQANSALRYLAQHPVLDLPFRSYFLLAVFCSISALALWTAYFNGYFSFAGSAISPLTWHIHEMIFGFAATVAVGFILTAAQTWTGQPSIKGLPVLAFIIIWLLVRVALLINSPSAFMVAVTLQTLWWLGSILMFSRLVLKSKNRRNYLFIPLLSTLMLLNIALLSLDYYGFADLARHIARTCVLMFCLLMGILGGRVIPFFTVSGAKVSAITTPSWLTPVLISVSILGILVFFSTAFIELAFTPATLMIAAGLLHLIRLSYWRTLVTIKLPLLWSLHCSYFALAIGLILVGLSYLPVGLPNDLLFSVSFGDALHLITIAAMGLMIFAMMSRVSLGHTGRALTPSKLVPWIFYLIVISSLARTFLPAIPLQSNHMLLSWNISALTWFIAAALFIKIYWPVLTSKKIAKSFHR